MRFITTAHISAQGRGFESEGVYKERVCSLDGLNSNNTLAAFVENSSEASHILFVSHQPEAHLRIRRGGKTRIRGENIWCLKFTFGNPVKDSLFFCLHCQTQYVFFASTSNHVFLRLKTHKPFHFSLRAILSPIYRGNSICKNSAGEKSKKPTDDGNVSTR